MIAVRYQLAPFELRIGDCYRSPSSLRPIDRQSLSCESERSAGKGTMETLTARAIDKILREAYRKTATHRLSIGALVPFPPMSSPHFVVLSLFMVPFGAYLSPERVLVLLEEFVDLARFVALLELLGADAEAQQVVEEIVAAARAGEALDGAAAVVVVVGGAAVVILRRCSRIIRVTVVPFARAKASRSSSRRSTTHSAAFRHLYSFRYVTFTSTPSTTNKHQFGRGSLGHSEITMRTEFSGFHAPFACLCTNSDRFIYILFRPESSTLGALART